MNTEIINPRERQALAIDAWSEAQSILGLMMKIDAENLDAIRGLVMRCEDLISVMAQAFDRESMEVEEAWKIMCGRDHRERRAAFIGRVNAEVEQPG